jgi:hypothetical protein
LQTTTRPLMMMVMMMVPTTMVRMMTVSHPLWRYPYAH